MRFSPVGVKEQAIIVLNLWLLVLGLVKEPGSA